jgi:monomeric sarcosine oxidase
VGSLKNAEVVVIGGGAMGCAAAWALARRGVKVRVLERFSHVHDQGSHGGFTRVIRHAYYEGEDYVPLIDEADAAFEALGERAGKSVIERCGLLEFGGLDDPLYVDSCRSLELHDVPHERVDAREAMRRWPITIPEDWQACLSPNSGYLRVKTSMDAMRAEAEAAGAVFDYGVQVREIVRGVPDLRVLIDSGEVIACDRVVLCVGAYAAQLLPGLLRKPPRGPLVAWRRVLAWTRPAPEHRQALRDMPVWGAMPPQGFFYGFPLHDEGVEGFKLACHVTDSLPRLNDAVDPEQVSRAVSADDLKPLEHYLARYMPTARGSFVHHQVCMYGQSQDGDFVIDLDPRDQRICLALGFSGHGFKFAPVIGELISDLLESGESSRQRDRFRIAKP